MSSKAALARRAERDLATLTRLAGGAPVTPATPRIPASTVTLVHQLRRLGGAAGALSTAERTALRASALRATKIYFVEPVAGRPRVLSGDLGMSPDTVAELFVETVDRMAGRTFRNLPRRGAPLVGREGNFNGRLFERLVLHRRDLHRDLRGLAVANVAGLNRLVAAPGRTPLLGVNGQPRALSVGRFGRPERVVELAIGLPGKHDVAWSPFVDGAYLSPFVPRGASVPSAWALLVGIEVKRPLASVDLPRQLGEHLDRLVGRDATHLRWRLPDGVAGDPIPLDQLVFSQQYRDLVGASASLTGSSEYRFVFADQAGYDEHFLRYDLLMDTSGIDDLSAALFRLVGR